MNLQQLLKLREKIVFGFENGFIHETTFFDLLEEIDPCVAMLEDF